MFYSQFILAKKGPLGTIWIAAHLERKLRKNQVADTDIGVSVDSILSPDVPIALRLSSHLLLGVVRIYSKKVNYLFDDCSEALLKVKQAFRSTAVDLPPEQSKAPYHSITLPETFDLDDFELPDNEMLQGNFVDHHVSTREQITLQDTMDGVSFPTSQFGLDERFGDGDASQIGLDLDEELFMDKGDGAGTSGTKAGTDVDPLESTQEASHSKGDELDVDVCNFSLASNTNNFSIQAPPTPGLMEEPNLAITKEEIQASDEHMDDHMDDHMDEDQNVSEIVAKEVSGTASSPMEPSDMGGVGLHSNGNLNEHSGQVREFETGSVDLISSGVAQPATFNDHLDATSDQNNVGINLENEGTIGADFQSKGCSGADDVLAPVAENAFTLPPQNCDPYTGYNKTDVNGNYLLSHDTGTENIMSSVSTASQGTAEAVKSVSEPHNSFQPCVNLQYRETFETISDEKPPGFVTPVLQACTSKLSSACDGVYNVCDSSNLPVQEDGSSFGTAGRDGTLNFCGFSSNAGDELELTSKEDQINHGVVYAADGQLELSLGNLIAEKNHFEKENNLELSNFPPPELLLSIPNMPAGQSHNFVVDSTPGREVFTKDCDATDENLLSGRKRSFTESILTFQSVNSVESSGRAQSKGTMESVPGDNDLLSSILVGKIPTGFKMKPTPPPDTGRSKRRRTVARSVVNKRKVLIDDSTVLHGDTIRQQLTNTEDIRRVRKKAPCTHLEVWVLQKQFLEDDMFSESVLTGMFSTLRSLHSEAFDLNGIRILRGDRNKEATEAGISTTVSGETEAIGLLVPSTADISAGPKLNEETEDVKTVASSVVEAEGFQVSDASLLATACEQEPSLVVDGSILLEEMQKADIDIMKEMSSLDLCGEKVGVEFDSMRISDGPEAMPSVASCAVPESSVGCASEINRNLPDHASVDTTHLEKPGDVATSLHIGQSGPLLDQSCPSHCASRDVSTMEDVSVSGTHEQGLDAGVSEKVDLDERSADEHILERREGFNTNLIAGYVQDSSLHDHDAGACATTEHVKECHPDGVKISEEDENLDSGRRHDGSYLTSNNIGDHLTLDSSFSVETDSGSQKTTLVEMESPLFCEDNPKIDMDSTPIVTDCVDTTNNAEFETGFIEHDTDFLNVDDDDVAEDYESDDVPGPEEKRILDNTGWSSRTRAVANYLQALFEKDYDQAERVVSLDNLLVGKTRKEASRMFFETLVLKTKDYIQAEQESSYSDIKVKPRGKLLKSEFRSHS